MGFEIAALAKRVSTSHPRHLVRFLNGAYCIYWRFRITFPLLNIYLAPLILLIVYQLVA